MPKYRVWMTVAGSTSVVIEASSENEAIEIANDQYAETQVSICHQCSSEISEPTIIEAVEAVEL